MNGPCNCHDAELSCNWVKRVVIHANMALIIVQNAECVCKCFFREGNRNNYICNRGKKEKENGVDIVADLLFFAIRFGILGFCQCLYFI